MRPMLCGMLIASSILSHGCDVSSRHEATLFVDNGGNGSPAVILLRDPQLSTRLTQAAGVRLYNPTACSCEITLGSQSCACAKVLLNGKELGRQPVQLQPHGEAEIILHPRKTPTSATTLTLGAEILASYPAGNQRARHFPIKRTIRFLDEIIIDPDIGVLRNDRGSQESCKVTVSWLCYKESDVGPSCVIGDGTTTVNITQHSTSVEYGPDIVRYQWSGVFTPTTWSLPRESGTREVTIRIVGRNSEVLATKKVSINFQPEARVKYEKYVNLGTVRLESSAEREILFETINNEPVRVDRVVSDTAELDVTIANRTFGGDLVRLRFHANETGRKTAWVEASASEPLRETIRFCVIANVVPKAPSASNR